MGRHGAGRTVCRQCMMSRMRPSYGSLCCLKRIGVSQRVGHTAPAITVIVGFDHQTSCVLSTIVDEKACPQTMLLLQPKNTVRRRLSSRRARCFTGNLLSASEGIPVGDRDFVSRRIIFCRETAQPTQQARAKRELLLYCYRSDSLR